MRIDQRKDKGKKNQRKKERQSSLLGTFSASPPMFESIVTLAAASRFCHPSLCCKPTRMHNPQHQHPNTIQAKPKSVAGGCCAQVGLVEQPFFHAASSFSSCSHVPAVPSPICAAAPCPTPAPFRTRPNAMTRAKIGRRIINIACRRIGACNAG